MEYEVTNLDHFGRGITRFNNKICFVYNALPGEVVELEIFSEKKDYVLARSSKIIKKSPLRKTSDCPYFLECGGCSLLFLDYQKQLEFKKQKVEEIFHKFASYNLDDLEIITDHEYYYRSKASFKVKDRSIAYNIINSNDLIAIDKCLLIDEELNRMIPFLNKYLASFTPFEKIVLKINTSNEILIEIEGKIDLEAFCDVLKDFKIKSIFVNERLVYGDDYLLMDVSGYKFSLSNKAFFQVNKYLTSKLYGLVTAYMEGKKIDKALDLYSGTATISILMSKYANKVLAVEENKEAVMNARKNLGLNNINNVVVVQGDVKDKIKNYRNIDFVVVDPPRRGLDREVVYSLLNMEPKYICYISCNPVTLARDAKMLMKKYDIEKVSLVDMFSNTNHIESVCMLKRR